MQSSLQVSTITSLSPVYRRYPAPLTGFRVVMAFFAAPLSLEQKAHAAMHGLCAQRPSHSLMIGERMLPFDARMAGIYVGFIVTLAALLASGRHRNARFMSIGSMVVVLMMAGAMAIDGFNSLFTDVRLPALYAPRNELRLFTGIGAGVGLAVMLTMLFGMTLWRRPRARARVLDRWWQPLGLYVLSLPVAALFLSGGSSVYAFLTILLVISATIAFSGLALVTLILLRGKENSFDGAVDLQPQIVLGVLAGIAAIGALSAMRYCVEAVTNAPPLT